MHAKASPPVLGQDRPSAMAEARATVFVVDDDVSVRESLEALIAFAGWEPRAFATAGGFLATPPATSPSCLVLDVGLPDLNGLDLQRRIAHDRAEMPILFITGHGDVRTTVRAMKAGAVEFLTKPLDDKVLLDAICVALMRSSATLVLAADLRSLRDRYGVLTAREREVMTLVVAGRLNRQVAAELGISEITVKAHRGRVMEKMAAGSFADLVRMSAALGFAWPPAAAGALRKAAWPDVTLADVDYTRSRINR
jgi:FixJ family two-component response regulator